VAFFRFSRDKRGYEHFYLVEPVTNRKGRSRPRILYWYRTPPNVKVGRVPFDDAMRRAIEAQYPDVSFDWAKIVEAPIPSADVEKWRERRRAERADRTARRSGGGDDADEESATDLADQPAPESTVQSADEPIDAAPPPQQTGDSGGAGRKRRRRRRGRQQTASAGSAPMAASPAEPANDVPEPPIDPPSGGGAIVDRSDGPADEPSEE